LSKYCPTEVLVLHQQLSDNCSQNEVLLDQLLPIHRRVDLRVPSHGRLLFSQTRLWPKKMKAQLVLRWGDSFVAFRTTHGGILTRQFN
jgi:hypothetical protein